MKSFRSYLSILAVASLQTAASAADVLLVTGNSNRTTPTGRLSLGDTYIKGHLVSVLHHDVLVLGDSVPKQDMLRVAQDADLVLVMESVTSATLTDKLKPANVPILNCEAFIQDEMGMTPRVRRGIRGRRTGSPWGSWKGRRG